MAISIEDFIDNLDKSCTKVQRKKFKKDEIITTYIAKRNQICILVSGSADLVRYDSNGNKTIIEHFTKNDIFGELFYVIVTNNELLALKNKELDVKALYSKIGSDVTDYNRKSVI